MIAMLSGLGYETMAECARQHMEQEFAKGRTLEEIFACREDAARIANLQIQKEQELRVEELTFSTGGYQTVSPFYPITDWIPMNC